jgi:hypothetical protein
VVAASKLKSKIEKEAKVQFKRAEARLKKASKQWSYDQKLMYGQVGPNGNGLAEPEGLFRSLVSNIFVQVPEVYFESKRIEGAQIAAFLGPAINYDFEIGNFRAACKRAIWRTFPYGIGYVAENVETDHEYSEKGERIGIRRQFFNWTNPPVRDVLVDPDGFRHDLYDHRFIFIADYPTVQDLHDAKDADGKALYSNLDNIENLSPANEASQYPEDARVRQTIGMGGNTKNDNNPKYKQLKRWRMYDRIGDKGTPMVYSFLDVDKRLICEEEWPAQVKIQGRLQFPVRAFVFSQEAEDFYPPSEVSYIRPQIVQKIKVFDQYISDSADNKIRTLIALSPYFTEAKLGKALKGGSSKKPVVLLTTNADALMAQANVPKVDEAGHALARLPDVMADPGALQALQVLDLQIQNIMGYGFPSRGGLPAIRSAKEAARVSDSMQRSLLDRQTSIENFTRDCANYHALLMKAVMPEDTDRYVRITDKSSAIGTWFQYNPNEIPDETDLFCDVYVGSSTPQSLDAKRAQWLQTMQIMWPLLEKMGMSPAPLLFEFAKIFAIKNPDQFMKNQKGAAQELLAAIVQAGRMGDGTQTRQMLLKAEMTFIDSVLNAAEKNQVFQAIQKSDEQKAKMGGAMKGAEQAQEMAGEGKGMPNSEGSVSLGDA